MNGGATPTERQLFRRCVEDPFFFFSEVLGIVRLTDDQRKVVSSVKANKRTAVPAGHGVGKDFLAAALTLQFFFTHPNSRVVTTAPSMDQVEGILWREIAKLYNGARVRLGGQLLTTRLDCGEDWLAVGISTNDPTRFQGRHAPGGVLVIGDEATGLPRWAIDAAEAMTVGPADRLLLIGNPTDPSSAFKECCDSGLWNVIEISSENHPNVVEKREVIAGAVTAEWCDEQLERYGSKDHPLYRARVLGKWPSVSDDTLISPQLLEDASKAWSAERAAESIVASGTDVARFGSDDTVTYPISKAGCVAAPIVRNGQDTMATTGQVRALRAPHNAIDDTGLGGGVTDRLRELEHPGVIAVNFGENATDEERFVDRRSEIWWNLREALRDGRISLPPISGKDGADRRWAARLHADLAAPRYSWDSRGRIRLEAKRDVKKRLGRSPDHGDALALAVAAFEVGHISPRSLADIAFGSTTFADDDLPSYSEDAA